MLVYDINNTKQYTDGMETLQKYIPPTETLKYVGLNSIDEKLFEQMTQAKKVVSVSRQLNDMISQLMNLNGKKHLNKEKSLTIFDADYLNKTAIEFEYEDYKFSIMCFYHPAFAIDGNQLGGAANYILKIKNHLDLEFKDSEFVCHTAKNYSELYDYVVPKVQSGKYTKVSYDIESNFKSPYSKDFKIVGFSLSFDGIEGIYAQLESFEDSMTDEDREKSLGLLKWVLSNEKLGIIVHNLMYELPTTLNNLGYEIPRTRLDDTMVMSKIINTSGRIGGNGLKDQGIMKLGLSDWSRDLDDFRKAVQDSIDNFKKLYGSRGKNFKTSIDLYDLSNDEILTDLLEKYNYDKDEIANMLKDYGRRVRENLKEDKEDYLSYGWVPSKLLSKYGAIDAIATRKLYDYFTEEMKSDSIKYNVDLFDGYSVYIESHYAGYQLELNSFCYDLKQAQLEEKAYRNVMRYDLVRLLSADKQEMKTHLEKVLRPKICKIYVENHIEEIESLSLGQTSTAYRYLDSEGNSKLVKKNKYVEICNVFNINRNKLYGELKKYIEYQIATKFQDLTYEEVVDLINPNTDESKELLVKLLSNEYIGGASFIINSLPYVVSQAYEVDKANKKYNPEEIEVFEIIKKYDEARLPEEKYKLFDNVIDQLKACRIGPTLASKLQEGGRWTMSTIDEANMTDLYDRLLLTGIDPDKDYERECEFSYLYSLRRYKKVYKVWTTYVLGDKLGISQVSEVEQLPMIRGDKLVRRERKSVSINTSTEGKTFMYQGTWKPNSVLSGRWASPIHTLPSMNGDTKRYMITRFKGGCIAAPDLSQAELRTVAKAAEEDMMLEAYRQGVDIHMKTAMGIFRKPASEVTEAERRYSKMCSFMILYGGSPKSLADQFLKGDMNMGLQLYNGFFEAYPKLRSWLDDRIKEVQDTGFITNMTGRHIRMGYARNDREKADLVRQSGNIPIQGSSSDIASSALYNIIDFITSRNLKSKAICFIHDSVEFDLAPDELFYTMEQIQYRMNNYPDERFGVPAKSDIVLGYSMGEECKVKKVTYSPDYSEGELHLEGLGECLLRLMWSWSHYFNVEFEIENYKEKKAPLAEIFGVKRTAHLRMGQIIPELDIIVKLTKKKFEQPEYDMIEGNLIPFKYYDCKMWRDWWINNSSGGKEKVVQKYDDSIVIMGLPKEEFGY